MTVTSEPSRAIARLAEVDEHVLAVGHLAAHAVERLVLDEDHGVLVADGALQQALGVGGGGGHGDEQAGDVQEQRLEAVRVGGPELVPGALGHAHDERHAGLAGEHVVDVRGVVDDLIEGEQGEVDRHQLDDGTQPGHGCADADADDRVLGDGRVAHALLAELVEQTVGDLEGATEDADVLAHQEDALVAAQLLAQGGAERLAVAQLGHQAASSPWASASDICCGISSRPSAWENSPEGAPSPAASSGSVVRTEYQPRELSPST